VADIVVFLFSCRGRTVSVETLCRCASGRSVKGACVSAWNVDLGQIGHRQAICVPICSTGSWHRLCKLPHRPTPAWRRP